MSNRRWVGVSLGICCALNLVRAALAGPITPGNIVVVRVGTGVTPLGPSASAAFLDEFTTAGMFVQSIPLPISAAAPNRRLTVSGSATSEGFVTLSPDYQYLVMAGYDAAAGTANVASTSPSAVNRVAARVTVADGSINTTTAVSDGFSTNVRCAATFDGTSFWMSGAGSNGGVRHVPLGGGPSQQLATTLTNVRVVSIFNDGLCDRLYLSSAAGGFLGVSTMGPCLPTTSGQTITNPAFFPGTPGLSSYDFLFVDATTVYIADDRSIASGGGVQKWQFDGSNWSLAYTLNAGLANGCRGLTGYVDGVGQVVLFATTAPSSGVNAVVTVTDTGVGAAFTALNSPVVAGANTVFRGLRYIPVIDACEPAVITADPISANPCDGEALELSVTASGDGPLAYQWLRDGEPIVDATGPAHLIESVTIADAGLYACEVTNACGSDASEPALVIVRDAPTINVQPSPAEACAGSTASFSIVADGDSPLSHQWRLNKQPLSNGPHITGADSPNLVINDVQVRDVGEYDCVVTNACGSVISDTAELSIDVADADDNSIPDCLETAQASLSLEVAGGEQCAQPGETLTVRLWMRNLGSVSAAGFQAFLRFDPTKLQFTSGEYSAAPFGLPVITPVAANAAGEIDLAAGINQLGGQGPTSSDAILATLTFTAVDASSCAPTLISFRSHDPPSRITDLSGQSIQPLALQDSAPVRVDGQAPLIADVPQDAIVTCGNIPDPPLTLPASDLCDASVTSAAYVGQSVAPGPCPQSFVITRSWSVTDNCGHQTVATQSIIVHDSSPPIISGVPGPVMVECSEVPPAPAALPAADVCDATVVQATYQGQSVKPGACVGSSVITRSWAAVDACGNTATASQLITTNDTTPPIISAPPPNATVSCASIPSAPPTIPASDACDAGVTQAAFQGDVVAAGTCAGSFTITRTWTASDSCGNAASVAQTITVFDDAPPTILSAPADVTVACGSVPSPAVLAAVDACDPSVTQATYEGEVSTPGDCPGDFVLLRAWSASDSCGNTTSISQIITVQDTQPPQFTESCPAIVVNADAGGCVASAGSVNAAAPVAIDACDAAPTITGTRSDGQPLDAPYDTGDTSITWTASDACGNTAQCVQLVTVRPFNTLVVDVQLAPSVAPALNRCITFELFDCAASAPVVVKRDMTFINGLAATTEIDVPCGNYSCLTARDRLHTLARRDADDFAIANATYVADFTAGGDDDSLIGGNFNDDHYIDILDFGMFAGQWSLALGGSTCLTAAPHADASGNGTVFTDDFTFISINFLDAAETACCAASSMTASNMAAAGPVLDIGVDDLWSLGMGELIGGDLNDDLRLNQLDVAALLQGAVPQPVAVFHPIDSFSWHDAANWTAGLQPTQAVRAFIPTLAIVGHGEAVAAETVVMPGGTLRLSAGTLIAERVVVRSGAQLLLEGAASVLAAAELVIEPGARFAWSGTLTPLSSSFSASPSAFPSASQARVMTVEGDLHQQADGVLHVTIDDAGASLLAVAGDLTLGGPLHVALNLSSPPQLGQRWLIADASLLRGGFTRIHAPTLPNGWSLTFEYAQTTASLVVTDASTEARHRTGSHSDQGGAVSILP